MSHGERGFTLVIVLIALGILAAGAAVVVPAWAHDAKRAQQHDFARAGQAYADAIARFRNASPGTVKQWPHSIDDLLIDRRYLAPVRHLRKPYADPINNNLPFVEVRNLQGRLVGVRSGSDAPIVGVATGSSGQALPHVRRYSEWVFSVETSR